MTVGTVARKVTRCSVTSRRNSLASNRGIRTRACLPMIWGVGGDDRGHDAFWCDFR